MFSKKGLPWELSENFDSANPWSTPFNLEGDARMLQGCSWKLSQKSTPSSIIMEVEIDSELWPYDPEAIPSEYLMSEESSQERPMIEGSRAEHQQQTVGVAEGQPVTTLVDPNAPGSEHLRSQESSKDIEQFMNETRPKHAGDGLVQGNFSKKKS